MPGISAIEILDACAAAQHPPVNSDPAWRTTEQLATEAGKSPEHTRRRLLIGLAGGVVKREKRYAKTGQRATMVDHWKFAGKTKKNAMK